MRETVIYQPDTLIHPLQGHALRIYNYLADKRGYSIGISDLTNQLRIGINTLRMYLVEVRKNGLESRGERLLTVDGYGRYALIDYDPKTKQVLTLDFEKKLEDYHKDKAQIFMKICYTGVMTDNITLRLPFRPEVLQMLEILALGYPYQVDMVTLNNKLLGYPPNLMHCANDNLRVMASEARRVLQGPYFPGSCELVGEDYSYRLQL